MISSLGLIEVVGLVGAIEAADTAAKAANVKVLECELTKGGGMVTVKIEGEVSAVTAAVEAAVMAAERLTTVVSKLVIARPSEELAKMISVDELEEEKDEIEIKEKVEKEEKPEVVVTAAVSEKIITEEAVAKEEVSSEKKK